MRPPFQFQVASSGYGGSPLSEHGLSGMQRLIRRLDRRLDFMNCQSVTKSNHESLRLR
jgi:hypothetical protein